MTEDERRAGQRLEIDAELHVDLARAGREDDLRATIDYAEVHRALAEAVEGREANLIEAIAERAAAALARFGARRVVVRVRKRAPPVAGGSVEFAEVEIARDAP